MEPAGGRDSPRLRGKAGLKKFLATIHVDFKLVFLRKMENVLNCSLERCLCVKMCVRENSKGHKLDGPFGWLYFVFLDTTLRKVWELPTARKPQ